MAKFEKGNPGGPGRPPRESEAAYLKTMLDGCTQADWDAITKRAVKDAKIGSWRAREWLSNYLLGKPIIRTQISGPDDQPIETTSTVVLDLSGLTSLQLDDLVKKLHD